MDAAIFTPQDLRETNPYVFAVIREAQNLEEARSRLLHLADRMELGAAGQTGADLSVGGHNRIRDCAVALRLMSKFSSDEATGFSVTQALWDIARHRSRPELTSAFYAEIFYLFKGLQGHGPRRALDFVHLSLIEAGGRVSPIM